MIEAKIAKKIYRLHAELCKTLADPTRLEVLNLLRNSEKSVGELAALTSVRQATISQHLAILRQKGVVLTRKDGTNIYYSVKNPKIIEASDIIKAVLFEQITEMETLTANAR
ncbi:MAG: hypothetical protein QG670_1973 [Thermoproteota archaeon]|nr:hypothetical protein [Thermoproteota archaeon]